MAQEELTQKERDTLTGLLTRQETQRQIETALRDKTASALILMDINRFSLINDRYGHLLGDRILQKTALAFKYMFWPRDIVGRIGGDLFAALIRANCSQQTVDDKTKQLRGRLRDISTEEKLRGGLTASIGAAFATPEDTYETLIARAREELLKNKAERKTASSSGRGEEAPVQASHKNICKDVALIRRELKESGKVEGAYCPDYESFKRIYHFVERGLRRGSTSAYVILLTLADEEGKFTPLAERVEQMEQLHDTIQHSLRSGDAFCQYSSGQYILMVLGASAENAERIAQRIKEAYTRTFPDGMGPVRLYHDIYPMDAT